MEPEKPVTPQLPLKSVHVVAMLVGLVLLIVGALAFASYNQSRQPGNPPLVAPAGAVVEQAPTAVVESYVPVQPYAPPGPPHVCPTCPYRHYPAQAAPCRYKHCIPQAPQVVACPYCKNRLSVACPCCSNAGQTGQVGEIGECHEEQPPAPVEPQ